MRTFDSKIKTMKTITIRIRSILFFTILITSQLHGQMIVTVAGNGIQGYNNDGIPAISSELNNPYNLAVDDSDNIYIADYDNNRIRKVSAATGIISTIAGTGTQGYSGDLGLAIFAELNQPRGIVVDAAGNVYICDQANFRVRKIDASTGIITTIVGIGNDGYSGDNGGATLAQISNCHSIAIDPNGDLVIADTWNHCIRKVNSTTGIITTIAGTGNPGYNGDSISSVAAKLFYPTGIAIDRFGNIFITDQENDRIRKLNVADSLIYTVGGIGISGYSGDGGPAVAAKINKPVGLAVDTSGVIYISDSYNYRVRKIDETGVISTLSGTGVPGYNGDNISCYLAQLNGSTDMSIDKSGNIYFCDPHNFRIRKIFKSQVGIESVSDAEYILLFPNPTTNQLHILSPDSKIASIEVVNLLGEKKSLNFQMNSTASHQEFIADASSLTAGIYFILMETEKGIMMKKFAKQ